MKVPSRLVILHYVLIFSGLMFSSGCATHSDFLRQPREHFYDAQLPEAHKELTQLQKKRWKDADIVSMDLAMVELMGGKTKEAETRLRGLRDRLDELEGKNYAIGTLSMFSDDQLRTYQGEDYEKVLLRTLLAISSLMQDGIDAEAYSLQINDKQEQLFERAIKDRDEQEIPKFVEAYRPLAIGHYLHGVLRERSFSNYDDASRSYKTAFELNPSCQSLKWDIHRVETSVHSEPGCGVLYVFALVGRGPYKVEVEEHATSDALLIADRIVSAVGPYSVPPTLAPIKIPKVVTPPKSIDRLVVRVDNTIIGPTDTITDVAQLAESTYQVALPQIMARAVARRVVKKSTVFAAKDQLAVQSPWASLAMDAAGVLWEGTESADTRCWGLLPREIQILRVEIPKGTHRVDLLPVVGNRPVSKGSSTEVTMVDGRNTYMLAYFPEDLPLAPPLVGPN